MEKIKEFSKTALALLITGILIILFIWFVAAQFFGFRIFIGI